MLRRLIPRCLRRSAFIALAVLGLMTVVSVPAMAATGGPSTASHVTPLSWGGVSCHYVHALTGASTHGTICILLNVSDITGSIQALVRFNSKSEIWRGSQIQILHSMPRASIIP
jgi:hypothetical protein